MGNCQCLTTPSNKQPPPIHPNEDMTLAGSQSPSSSPPPTPRHKTSILSIASMSSATTLDDHYIQNHNHSTQSTPTINPTHTNINNHNSNSNPSTPNPSTTNPSTPNPNSNSNPTSPTMTNSDDNRLRILTTNNTTYNAMISTRDRNLTATSATSNTSNSIPSSIEQLYEIASVPDTYNNTSNPDHISNTDQHENTSNTHNNDDPQQQQNKQSTENLEDISQVSERKPLTTKEHQHEDQHKEEEEEENKEMKQQKTTTIPSIATLSKQSQPKHLPIPIPNNNKTVTVNTTKQTNPASSHPNKYKQQLTKGKSHSQSSVFITSTPPGTPPMPACQQPPSYYPSPSPPLRSQNSQRSLSNISSTLSMTSTGNASTNFNFATNTTTNMAALPQRNERYSNSSIKTIKHVSHLKNRERNWNFSTSNVINNSYNKSGLGLYDNDNDSNYLTPQILTSDTTSLSCSCDEIQNSILDIITLPSIWSIDHDDMLKYMLSQWSMPLDLFETFKSFIHIDGTAVCKPKNGSYHKRIRDGLRACPFCPCWYDTFEDGFRIMQFGYCPGTTQFALRFTRNGHNGNGNSKNFEARSRFVTNIDMNTVHKIDQNQCINNKYDPRKVLGVEIFDMNIAEFPTMIPSYLESYDPHVILLLFDVADRSSFDGIIKMRKSLENLYKSMEEKTDYELSTGNNHNSSRNLKRFHDSFDALASVFGFGGNNDERDRGKSKSKSKVDTIDENERYIDDELPSKSKRRHQKTRSNSVASLLSNISSSLKNNASKVNPKSKSIDKTTVLKRSRTHSNLNKFNSSKSGPSSPFNTATQLVTRYSSESAKVNKSNRNEFTIQPLSEGNDTLNYNHRDSFSTTLTTPTVPGQCTSFNNSDIACYYHSGNDHTQSMISSMPPILVIGIQADCDDKDRNVSIEEGIELSKEWDVPYLETSATNGINVHDVFIECIRTRWVYDTYPNVRMRSRALLIT